MSSRLFVQVREKLGIAYYVKTSASADTDTGFLVTQAGISHSKVESVIKTILKEYQRIKTKKISKSELQKAKDNFQGTLSLSLESSDAQAAFYAGQELLTNKIISPKEQIERINKVTADDILKLAKDIFQPHKLNLALIGPLKDKTKFQKILKI